MLLFKKPVNKKSKEVSEAELSKLDSLIAQRRKELKFLEVPLEEKKNILALKEQELFDREQELLIIQSGVNHQQENLTNLADKLGEKSLNLNKRSELIELKEKVLKEKEDEFIKKQWMEH